MEQDVAQGLSIDGLTWTAKKTVSDDRGAVKLMLKDGQFDFPVGEIYFSIVKPGIVKGWKYHREMVQRLTVPLGTVQFVFVDQREGSPTNGAVCEVTCGEESYGLITVPARIWYSFRGEGKSPAVIANAASIPRKVGESEVIDTAKFEYYHWKF